VSDTLAWGRQIQPLTVMEVCTREALAITVATSLLGGRVGRVSERFVDERGVPDEIVVEPVRN
jgi:putative transposase